MKRNYLNSNLLSLAITLFFTSMPLAAMHIKPYVALGLGGVAINVDTQYNNIYGHFTDNTGGLAAMATLGAMVTDNIGVQLDALAGGSVDIFDSEGLAAYALSAIYNIPFKQGSNNLYFKLGMAHVNVSEQDLCNPTCALPSGSSSNVQLAKTYAPLIGLGFRHAINDSHVNLAIEINDIPISDRHPDGIVDKYNANYLLATVNLAYYFS